MSKLTEAVRQYRHNNSDDFVMGYDKNIVDKYIATLDHRIKDLEDLANTVAHVGVDFGYGEFQLESQHIEQARKLVPLK